MKRILLPLLFAALGAAIPASAGIDPLVHGMVSGDSINGPLDVLEETLFFAEETANESFDDGYVDWVQGSTRIHIYLAHSDDVGTAVGIEDWVGRRGWYARLPNNHAGKAICNWSLVKEGENPTTGIEEYTLLENTTSDDGMNYVRYPDIYNWNTMVTKVVSTDNDSAWWYQKDVIYGTSDETKRQLGLLGAKDSSKDPIETGGTLNSGAIYSRKMNSGVGSIWFKAKMAYTNHPGGTLLVGKLTTTGSRRRTWYYTPIAEVYVPQAKNYNEWLQFHLIIQDTADINNTARCDDHKASYIIYNNTQAVSPTGEAISDSDRDAARIDISDIALTPLIPDVRIVKAALDYDPGFPSVEDPVTFRISVSNLYEGARAEFITPRLVWRQGEDDEWKSPVMTNVRGREFQTEGEYVCVLSADESVDEEHRIADGPFEYFYEVSFTGYTPTFPAIQYPTGGGGNLNNVVNGAYLEEYFHRYVIATNDWALLTDEDGIVSECRSPASYPDFVMRADGIDETAAKYDPYSYSWDVVDDSPAGYTQSGSRWDFTHCFDLRNLYGGWPVGAARFYERTGAREITFHEGSIQIPADFPFLELRAKDGIRRFRSLYTDLAAVTADWGTNVQSHLLPAYPMQHVGDYTWQALIHITNHIDAAFSVTGALYAAAGATDYAEGPFEWLEIDQEETDINPPMSGALTAERDTSLRRFQTYPEPRVETNAVEKEVFNYDYLQSDGWFVGVVTNALYYSPDYTNEYGGAVEPTEADVFWRWRYWTVEDPVYDSNDWTQVIGYETRTNSVVIEENWFQDANDAWYGVVARGNAPIQSFLQRPDKILFTNENWSVVTGRVRIQPFSVLTNEVRHYEVYVPLASDIAEANGGVAPQRIRTEVDIDYDGFLMYRFCTTNGAYQIRRAAWQDFNEWQADDRWYSRSAGLYDMKAFTTDFEGIPVTDFRADSEELSGFTTIFLDELARKDAAARRAAARLAGEPVNVTGWFRSPTGLPNPWLGLVQDANLGGRGLYGRNVQLLEDRMGNDRDEHRGESNGAVLLNTYPDDEGTLETSYMQRGDGRDTLKMRVRSFTDDDRSITYSTAPSSAQNYRVVARLRSPSSEQVSDGEHALSLIGYWQDPLNYWEARIIQKSAFVAGGTPTAPATKNWFDVHIYKWVDGEPSEVYGKAWNRDQRGNSQVNNWEGQTSKNRVAQWPLWNNNGNTNGNDNAYTGNDAEYGLFTNSKEGGWAFAFDLYTSPDGQTVTPAVYAFLQGKLTSKATEINLATNYSAARHCFAFVGFPTTGGTTSGRPGFNLRDCGLHIAPYVYDLTAANGEMDRLKTWATSRSATWGDPGGNNAYGVATSADSAWDHTKGGSYDRYQKIDVWKVTKGGASDSTPTTIERKTPTVWYRVEVYRPEIEVLPEDGFDRAPIGKVYAGKEAEWDDEWDSYNHHRSDGWRSATSWRWKTEELPMNFWDDTYIRIHAFAEKDASSPSLALLAVDSLSCDPWRGVDVKVPDRDDVADEEAWLARYAAIEYDGVHNEGRKLELNRSRANPNQNAVTKAQGVATPLLENGVGDISFTYTVEKYPVRVRVGVLDQAGTFSILRDEVLPVTEKSSPYYVYVATNVTGRIYVQAMDTTNANARANGQLGTLHVDNLRATDYPATGSTSWDIYNALVSTFPSNVAQRAGLGDLLLRKAKFDGVSAAARNLRSAVLNDGVREQTRNGIIYDESVPYLQTPTIETGVGEVSFWYRASPDNGLPTPSRPAQIRLMAADSPSRPFSEWTQLTVDDLYSDREDNPLYDEQVRAMEGLTNITTTSWTYFNVEFYKQEYRVLRIVAGDADVTVDTLPIPNRVMLDNVLITEPVRASIDVGTIQFIPDIPLVTRDTHARVTLVNPRMNPGVTNVVLEWFIAPGNLATHPVESVSYTTTTNQLGPYYTTVELPRGGTMQVPYYIPDVITTENRWNEDTRVQSSLRDATRMWGYESWSNQWAKTPGARGGSISLTNTGESAYTYYTTEPIPTKGLDPDMVLQYCVKVEYSGRFNAPVYSELQGKTKNGYEFHNPGWYDPIDLNVAFGTTNWPVSHAFLFSCPTNTVFINEIRPAAITTGPDAFVELMGPAGASLANWRMEHFGTANSVYSPKVVRYTNILDGAAAFIERPGLLNKGWGFWVLGNYRAKQQWGDDRVNQELFPPEIADKNNNGPMTVPGALRLRRSMGAYDNKVVWGQAGRISAFVQPGVDFEWAGNLTSGSLSISKADADGNWANAEFTVSDYNKGEEDLLPFADGYVPPARVPAQLDPPVITGIEFVSSTRVRIDFRVRLDPEDAAAGLYVEEGDYEWTVETTDDLSDWAGVGYSFADYNIPIPVPPASGEWLDVSVEVPANSDVLLFRLRATPKE